MIAAGAACLIVGIVSFTAGWMTGTRNEMVNASSAHVGMTLLALRQINANDLPGAKDTLFTDLGHQVLTHWSTRRTGILDYPQGQAPEDVQLMERVIKARLQLARDPDIAAMIAKHQSEKYYPEVAAQLKIVEAHYVSRP